MHEDSNQVAFNFQLVTESEVEKIIKSLSSNKAPGIDKVSAKILKYSLPATLPILTRIFNNSFAACTFPRAWKISEVTPIFKSRDFDNPSNTRPISLLPILSKVCEKLAHKQFVNYLNYNSKIAKQQSGNRQFHSTETALLHFTDEILKNMDKKKVSLVVLLDMSKAFDSVNHELLLSKLRKIGVSTSAHKWFKSYLIDHSQVVKIKDTTSKALPLEFRVAQRSILDSLLFTIYINDLPLVPRYCQSAIYVDDDKLFLAFQPCEILKAIQLLNLDLVEIARWCCLNFLLVNPDKTKLLVMGVPQLLQRLPPLSVTFLGKEISPVPVAKDLGVFTDETLLYNEHISKTVSSCLYKLTQINRIKHLLDKKTLLLLLSAFIFNRSFYCSTVWSNTSNSNLKKLQLVQNFAARLILGLRKFDHISEGHKSLKWLNVKDRLFLNDAVMVHRCLQDKPPEYLKGKFIKRQEVSGRSKGDTAQP